MATATGQAPRASPSQKRRCGTRHARLYKTIQCRARHASSSLASMARVCVLCQCVPVCHVIVYHVIEAACAKHGEQPHLSTASHRAFASTLRAVDGEAFCGGFPQQLHELRREAASRCRRAPADSIKSSAQNLHELLGEHARRDEAGALSSHYRSGTGSEGSSPSPVGERCGGSHEG